MTKVEKDHKIIGHRRKLITLRIAIYWFVLSLLLIVAASVLYESRLIGFSITRLIIVSLGGLTALSGIIGITLTALSNTCPFCEEMTGNVSRPSCPFCHEELTLNHRERAEI